MAKDNPRIASDQAMLAETDDDPQPHRPHPVLTLLHGRYHLVILLAVLLGGAGAIVGWYMEEPAYQSMGRLRLSPDTRPILYQTEVSEPVRMYESYMDAQATFMQSRPVIQRALEHEAWQGLGRGADDGQLQRFTNSLEIQHARRRQVIEVAFRDESPEGAAAGVEAIIDAYWRTYLQQRMGEDARIHRELEQRQERLEQRIEGLRNQRSAAAGEYGVEGLQPRYEMKLSELMRIDQMRRQLAIQIDLVESQIEEGVFADAVTPEQLATQDDYMRALLEQKRELENLIRSNVHMGMGQNHREVRRARAQLDAVDRRINEYMESAPAPTPAPMTDELDPTAVPALGQPGSLAELEARYADLEDLYEHTEQEAVALSQQLEQIRRIEAEIDANSERLEMASRRMEELDVESAHADRIEVFDYGRVPTQPYNTMRRAQLAGLGGVGGAGVGVALVMLIAMLNRRLRGVHDTQSALSTTRMLGILPTLADEPEPAQIATASHCVHHIRTLLQIGQHQDSRVFVITSPTAGSGKTSLTTALGLSFAASDTRTLLIDCDLVGGGLSRRLGGVAHRSVERIAEREKLASRAQIEEARRVAQTSQSSVLDALVELGHISRADAERIVAMQRDSSIGILDACEADEPFERCVVHTGIDHLYLLPVGTSGPSQSGALSPAGLQSVLDHARARFDVVLVDTGPILGSVEASLCATEADAALLVVSRGDEKSIVTRSLSYLDSIRARTAGLVFNRASSDDLERSEYTSATSGSLSRADGATTIDDETTERLGPIGAAVASCSRQNRQPMLEPALNGERHD